MFKIIYLSIHFSYVGLDVGLDYDNLNTILLFSKKKLLYFFPFGIVVLVFFFKKRKKSCNLLFLFIFLLNLVLLSFINFLHKFLGVFDCMVENFWFKKVCLKLKENFQILYNF